MKIVLHSKEDLEPITIIELPFDGYRALLKDKVINLNVSGTNTTLKIYCIATYGIDGNKHESFGNIFVVDNDVVALALVPALLLGQENFKNLRNIKWK